MIINVLKNIIINKKYYAIISVFIFIISIIYNYCFFNIISMDLKINEIQNQFKTRYTFTDINGYDARSTIASFNKGEIVNFCKSKYVDDFILTYKTNIIIENFISTVNNNQIAPFMPIEGYYYENGYDINIIDEFMLGINKLVKGRIFERDNEIIISDVLAEINNVDINDTIYIESGQKLKIVGIFSVINNYYELDSSIRKNLFMSDILNNLIYTTFNTVCDISNSKLINIYDIYPIFSIQNNENAEIFYNELLEKGYPNNLYVKNDRTLHSQITRKMDMTKTSLFLVYIFCISAGALILCLFIFIILKNKKYNFAILISTNIKKLKFFIFLFIENFIVIFCISTSGLLVAKIITPILNSFIFSNRFLGFNLKFIFNIDTVMQHFIYMIILTILSILIFILYTKRFSHNNFEYYNKPKS